MATEAPPRRGRPPKDAAFAGPEKKSETVTAYYTKIEDRFDREQQAKYAELGYECKDEGWRLAFSTSRKNAEAIEQRLHKEAMQRSQGGRIGRTESRTNREGVSELSIVERDFDVRGMEPKGLSDGEISNDDLMGDD